MRFVIVCRKEDLLVVAELWCRVRGTAGRVCSVLRVYSAVLR